jgi:DNA-binding CsgD family transcriptional regulator
MRGDAIRVIEASYDLEGETGDWLRRIGAAALALTSGKTGLAAMIWGAERRRIALTHTHVEGDPDFDPAILRAIIDGDRSVELAALFLDAPPVGLASREVAHGLRDRLANPSLAALTMRYRARDFVGVNGRAHARRGIALSFALGAGEALAVDARRMWSRLAVHLGSGLRLHDRLGAGGAVTPAAILAPAGRLLHVEPAAAEPRTRDELAAAARAIDRARGKLRRVDPDEAVAIWRGLVCGEWSLVDRFDSDGRRFVVAHRNVPAPEPRIEALTPREAQAVALLARGYADKLIAYELGLAPSTVAGLLARAGRKLGADSNVELIRIVRARSTK